MGVEVGVPTGCCGVGVGVGVVEGVGVFVGVGVVSGEPGAAARVTVTV